MASLKNLLLLLTASLTSVQAQAPGENHLISRRKLSKRFIDENGNYNISFYHLNDVHAHLDEFSSSGTDCTRPERGCFGGYARIKTVLQETRPSHPDSLLLNAGDEFQGTMFFSYYGGEKIAQTLNEIGFDAMTLGNHEFDKGDDHLGEFLSNLTFPIVSANIQSSHPVLNKTIKPFHIFEEYQLAVIGVTTETTPGISSPGPDTKFSDPIEAVQNTIDFIRSTTNIKRIAALTHIGYEEDQRLAQETTGLHLIMGGHSHTPLGNFTGAVGPYPTLVDNKAGEEVFIVTAYRWGEYLGYIDVTYDSEGRILEYHGAPIHLTNTTEQEPGLQAEIDAWRKPFEEYAAEEVGYTTVELDQSLCQLGECLLGDFMADAMLEYRLNSSSVDFALINAGGIRATIDAGPITRGEVLTAFPFGNSIVEITVTGKQLWDTFAGILTKVNPRNGKPVTSFFQISKNIIVEYVPKKNSTAATAEGELVSVSIGGEPLDLEKEYKVVTLDFIAGGGDNFFYPTFGNLITLDTQDQVLLGYIERLSPVEYALDRRIKTISKCRRKWVERERKKRAAEKKKRGL
ncbi:putative 5'-nucleotidase precursor [Podospora fimiseda]|uniref:5'-nucleotidase n=1 Tax=Podospora fimiseda TaxID=252190 RepID=A0AAN7BH93_9PEZI|nr:putative 5'-nucleotidase precursor [Podospora fimiseda]